MKRHLCPVCKTLCLPVADVPLVCIVLFKATTEQCVHFLFNFEPYYAVPESVFSCVYYLEFNAMHSQLQ